MSGPLEVQRLTKRFNGIPAVDDVSFAIQPGEILGYLGPNGAGKSTTVKMLIGLLAPSGGRILYGGRSVIDDMPAFQERLGYVPEEPNLYPFLSGREYLLLTGRLRGIGREQLDRKIDTFLRLFSLFDDGDAPVSSYSKGMRQKILLSAALLHDPEVLVLDEPLSGLDANTMIAVRELLRSLSARGKMILYCSHVLDAMEKVCARVLILRKGRVVAYDTIERLREQMDQTSLEGVFTRFTGDDVRRDLAGRILEAMRA
ncbi:MAG TPA: ABC transporter ATP-binding protein [Candidatus Acidoferrales bacterium]|nr:ABC transporter ATP-binding protein [Candidatus Acidoferrales bacterium]